MASGVMKHSVPGDVLTCSLQEVKELMDGGGSGKIKRLHEIQVHLFSACMQEV